jgi:hypothetical protein
MIRLVKPAQSSADRIPARLLPAARSAKPDHVADLLAWLLAIARSKRDKAA